MELFLISLPVLWAVFLVWSRFREDARQMVKAHEMIAREQASDLRQWREQMERAAVQNALGLPSMGFGPCEIEYEAETRDCSFCGRGGLRPGQSCPGCGAAD